MHHNRAAACAPIAAAQIQHSGSVKGTGQGCSQKADSPNKHSTAAAHEHVKDVQMMPAPCLPSMAAVNRCAAGDADHKQSHANATDSNAFSSSGQPSTETNMVAHWQNASSEGQATVADEQNGSPEGQATVANGQNESPDGQAIVPDGQHGSCEEQTAIADGQAAKTDGQGLHADATIDKQPALADGAPAVLHDTISEACCVCKSAEDGEVMLLCDNCDQPAHLGCVGVDTVPEGDWFCPSCMPAMVSISALFGTEASPPSCHTTASSKIKLVLLCSSCIGLVLHCPSPTIQDAQHHASVTCTVIIMSAVVTLPT